MKVTFFGVVTTFFLTLFFSAVVHASGVADTMIAELRLQITGEFSAEAGAAFWAKDFDGKSCTTCHTDSLYGRGRHQKTGKIIEPMAPSVNPERLTDRRKIDKWFLRNCKWTLGRQCTVREKGDVLLWLRGQ